MERYRKRFESRDKQAFNLQEDLRQEFPSETLEKILKIKGLSYKYNLPEGKNEHYWADRILNADNKKNFVFIEKFYSLILKKNKNLSDIKIIRKNSKKDYGDMWFVIWGVLSRFTPEDIQAFINNDEFYIINIFEYLEKLYPNKYFRFLPSYKHQEKIKTAFDKIYDIKLTEDLHLKDFTKHSGASDFTKDWIEIRRKIVGAGNKSSKIHSIKVNRKKDYIIFIFKSKPTYDAVVDSVDVNSFAKGKKVRKYTQRIMVLDFFKYLETKPNYEDANVTWKEIKECLGVCPIKVDCNCMAQTYQGLSYYLTQLDGAIVPNNIKPRVWNKYHDINGDVGFLCKHLSMIFNSILFFKTNFTSMINKYLRQKKN